MRKKLSRDEQISRGIADLVRLYIADHSDPVGMLMMAHGAYDDLETRYKLEVSTYARDAGISEEALRGLINKNAVAVDGAGTVSKLLKDCWHCDLCGHAWLVVNAEIIPAQCTRCRHRGWNVNKTADTQGSSFKQTARRTLRRGEILRFTILTGKDDLPLDTDFKVIALPEGDAEDFYRTKHHKGKRFATVGLEVIEAKPKQSKHEQAALELEQRILDCLKDCKGSEYTDGIVQTLGEQNRKVYQALRRLAKQGKVEWVGAQDHLAAGGNNTAYWHLMEGEQTAQGKPNRSGETQSLSVLGDASGEDGEKQNTQARAVCSPRRREKSVPEKILCGATRGKAVDCTHGKPSGGFDEHDPNAYEGASFQEAYDKAVEPFMQLVKEGEARGWITTAPRKPVQSAHKPKIVAQGRTHNGLYKYTCSAGHRWTSTAPESGGCTRCEQAKPEQIAQKKPRLTHIPRHDAVGFALCERDGELVTLNRRNRARLSEEATCAKCQRVRREAKKEDERQAREAEQWAKENPEDEQTAQEKS